MLKPSLSDIKYNKMDFNETMLNYERDMMLWEQTEALKKISNGDNSSSSLDVPVLSPTKNRLENLHQDICNDWHNYPNNFKYNSPLYNEHKNFENEISNLYDRAFDLQYDSKVFPYALLTLVIIFGIPALFIASEPTAILISKLFVYISIPVVIISNLLINKRTNKLIDKAQELRREFAEFIKNNSHENINKPKRYIKRKEKIKKEVLTLQH